MEYLCRMETKKMLARLGIDALNEMQQISAETIVNERDTMLLSATGSGKTLAFLLPVLQLLKPEILSVQCLILVPSRELGLQIEKVWKLMGTEFKVNICYGGHSIETEIKNLSNAPAVLIGTPGRIMDHLERKSFRTDKIVTLVLDEFDKSLQLGFHEEMSFIIGKLDRIDKRVLVSATANVEIPRYTKIVNPVVLDFTASQKSNKLLSVFEVKSDDKDKVNTLFRLVCSLKSEQAIVFCNHRDAAERIADSLVSRGIFATFYHGGLEQDERERALTMFRNKSISYLITTDLAARGLDIPEMKHVVHYHLPSKLEEFTHRNGRTARMESAGNAYVITHESEKKVDYLDKKMTVMVLQDKYALPKPPEFQTIYVSGGKKNKLNKGDIVGFFLQKGKLEAADLGVIEVKDFVSFVAVKYGKVTACLGLIKDEKMKGKRWKIEVARGVSKSVEKV